MNDRAEVIGINTAIIRGSQGIGFAINIDDAKVVAAQLIAKGFVQRGFLGIRPVNVTPEVIIQYNLGLPVGVREGILIALVHSDTAAEKAGLQAGDVIVQLGDEPVANTGELNKILLNHLPGETVVIAYYRDSVRRTVKVTLGEVPREQD